MEGMNFNSRWREFMDLSVYASLLIELLNRHSKYQVVKSLKHSLVHCQ
jgi:hypothetical protein